MSSSTLNGLSHSTSTPSPPSPKPLSPTSSPSSSTSPSPYPSPSSHLHPVPDLFPPPPPGASRLIVLGSGSSTGVPRGCCILTDDIKCRTCRLALQGRPEDNRNWRSNPSILLRYLHPPTSTYRHIQVDAGKTFRESMLRWYRRHHVHSLHALLLSHEHADAAFGLDDLRSLQRFNEVSGLPLAGAIPIHLSAHSMDSIERRFAYLVDKEAAASTIRRVAQLTYHTHSDHETFSVEGLPVRTLPVEHGPDYIAWGFSFAQGHVVYISDVSHIPPDTDEYLMSLASAPASACASCALAGVELVQKGGGIHLLVLDSLFVDRGHPTHMSMGEALECVRRYRPHRTLLIGLSDDFEYGAVTERLKRLWEEEGLLVELCYDGMGVDLVL